MAEAAPPAKKKKRSPIILIGAILFLLLGVGSAGAAALYLGLIGGGSDESTEEGEGGGEGEGGEEGQGGEKGGEGEGAGGGEGVADDLSRRLGLADESLVTNMGAFTVNLRGSGGGRVLRLEIQLEGPASEADIVKAREARIRDAVITAASDYTWAELEGTDGKTRLRDELLARVNGASSPAVIEHLYFTQFVIQ